jgi:CheY-like chemotaxis protein
MHEREDELRIARDQADSASVAKGDFLAQMSHEIRTPMNAIIGYTDLMLQTNLDTLQTEQISIIKRSGKALLNLINNILDYSKIESRTLELESVEFDIEQLISEAIEYVDPDAIEKGVEINYEIDPLLSETYVGDVHQIRQVLMNLANNAVKFTVKGSVLISVSKNVKQSDALSDAIHFEVEDSGYGIPRDKFDRLFKPFTQVDPSTTREYGGTGLGLVICQRLVEQMNGKIWVESAIGVGSNFQFIIPLPRPDQIRASRAPFVISAHSNNEDRDELSEEFATEYPLRILVCEDDNDNQWVIKELLEIMGYRPKVVDDGVKAMEFMQRREYDVVLMDVRLPDHNGIELTRAIRKGTLTNCKPDQYIIAVTAFAMNEDRDKCLKAGMNDYLSKPIEVSLLKDALIKAHSTLMMS